MHACSVRYGSVGCAKLRFGPQSLVSEPSARWPSRRVVVGARTTLDPRKSLSRHALQRCALLSNLQPGAPALNCRSCRAGARVRAIMRATAVVAALVAAVRVRAFDVYDVRVLARRPRRRIDGYDSAPSDERSRELTGTPPRKKNGPSEQVEKIGRGGRSRQPRTIEREALAGCVGPRSQRSGSRRRRGRDVDTPRPRGGDNAAGATWMLRGRAEGTVLAGRIAATRRGYSEAARRGRISTRRRRSSCPWATRSATATR